MLTVNFEQSNAVLHPPKGADPAKIEPLFVARTVTTIGEHWLPAVVSCWKPTVAEMEEITRTGRVWVVILGEAVPAMTVTGFSPFTDSTPSLAAD